MYYNPQTRLICSQAYVARVTLLKAVRKAASTTNAQRNACNRELRLLEALYYAVRGSIYTEIGNRYHAFRYTPPIGWYDAPLYSRANLQTACANTECYYQDACAIDAKLAQYAEKYPHA